MGLKAIPVPTELDRPYWDGAAEHKLVLQTCAACGLINAKPRVICPQCHGDAFTWRQVSGSGTIHSYTIVHQTTAPGFDEEIPFVIVHVQIAEEPTCYVTANLLIDVEDHHKIDIDREVIVEFETRGDVTLPQFRMV